MKRINKQRKQRGFALLEVMIAALVLTVGGVAYMKLQQMSLQSGFNNAARTRGVALINGFTEQLRSNVNYIRTATAPIAGSITTAPGTAPPPPSTVANCDSETDDVGCATTIFDLHQFLISQQMLQITPAGNSRLCYTESNTNSGLIRMTFQWRDNSPAGQTINLTGACPAFNATINQNNSVTMYVQL